MDEQTTVNAVENFAELTQLFNEQKITTYSTDTSILDIIKTTLEGSHLNNGFFIVDLSVIINQ